jgi:hypothetical protein
MRGGAGFGWLRPGILDGLWGSSQGVTWRSRCCESALSGGMSWCRLPRYRRHDAMNALVPVSAAFLSEEWWRAVALQGRSMKIGASELIARERCEGCLNSSWRASTVESGAVFQHGWVASSNCRALRAQPIVILHG